MTIYHYTNTTADTFPKLETSAGTLPPLSGEFALCGAPQYGLFFAAADIFCVNCKACMHLYWVNCHLMISIGTMMANLCRIRPLSISLEDMLVYLSNRSFHVDAIKAATRLTQLLESEPVEPIFVDRQVNW